MRAAVTLIRQRQSCTFLRVPICEARPGSFSAEVKRPTVGVTTFARIFFRPTLICKRTWLAIHSCACWQSLSKVGGRLSGKAGSRLRFSWQLLWTGVVRGPGSARRQLLRPSRVGNRLWPTSTTWWRLLLALRLGRLPAQGVASAAHWPGPRVAGIQRYRRNSRPLLICPIQHSWLIGFGWRWGECWQRVGSTSW